jgi:predicted nucleotidyltransferase
LDEIVRRIVGHADPERVVLFGSRAWGSPRQDSDVDLLVVTSRDDPGEPAMDQAIALRQALQPHVISIDLLVRTQRQVAQRLRIGDPFLKEVLERGRTLYDRSAAAARR